MSNIRTSRLYLYRQKKFDFLTPFSKKVLKKHKSAHSYPVAVCAYSLVADIRLELLGNNTYAVGVLLCFYYSTCGRICQERAPCCERSAWNSYHRRGASRCARRFGQMLSYTRATRESSLRVVRKLCHPRRVILERSRPLFVFLPSCLDRRAQKSYNVDW